jgi:hypothetical protein
MNAHRNAYIALSAIHAVIAAVLLAEAALLHSACALAAAVIYAALATFTGGGGQDAEKPE